MDPFVFLLAGLGLAVPLIAKAVFHHSICPKEWAIQTAVLLVVLLSAFFLLRGAQTWDVRVQNGELVSKERDRVSCSHSYRCNCRTVTRNGESRQECDTCHEHTHDYDWVLHTTVGNLKVPRIDRQGRHEPPRFSSAQPGDPVAVTEHWSNPIKGAPHSVFRGDIQEDEQAADLPTYPSTIVDIHTLDRVFAVRGAHLGDLVAWNTQLAERLKTIGREVRGNVIVVATGDGDRAFAGLLERRWLRGKSNDTVVVLGVANGRIAWAEAFGWSDDPRLYVDLRHDLEGMNVDPNTVLAAVERSVVAHFKAIPPERFDHLASDVRLPSWAYVLLGLLSLGLSIGTTWWFHTHTTFPTHGAQRPFRRHS